MSGTPRGIHSSAIYSSTAENNGKDWFVSIYRAMQRLIDVGYVQGVASYFGSGGTGFQFTKDSSLNPGNGAFGVWKFPSHDDRDWEWYILIQYCFGSNFDAGNGNPGLIYNGSGSSNVSSIGISVAAAIDAMGDPFNPWTGTTNYNGADTKSNPVWDNMGLASQLFVCPRSNMFGGTHAVGRQNTTRINTTDSSVMNRRTHVIADKDNIAILLDTNDNNIIETTYVAGQIKPLQFIGPQIGCPLFSLKIITIPGNSTDIGTTLGQSDPDGGTSIFNGGYNGNTKTYRIDCRPLDGTDASYLYSPNRQSDTRSLTEWSIPIYVSEAGIQGLVGFADSDFIRVVRGAHNNTLLSNKTRITSGTTDTNVATSQRISVPWDGVTSDPTSNMTPEGISF